MLWPVLLVISSKNLKNSFARQLKAVIMSHKHRFDPVNGYELSKCGYKHDRVVLSDTGDPAHISMPGVHRVAALVKRWLLSTHQGAVSSKHLDYYLDEYTFRFNRRTSRSRGMLFYRLMQQAVLTSPLPYRKIVERKHNI